LKDRGILGANAGLGLANTSPSWGAASGAPTEYYSAWLGEDGDTYRRGAEGAKKS